MTVVHAAVLGLVQGVTEFLPISSSAHLILARAFLGWDAAQLGLSFDIACHLGTLMAIVIYFRDEAGRLARAVPRMFRARITGDARYAQLIVAGTIPVVAAGLLYTSAVEAALRIPEVTIVTLAAGAVAFLWADRVGDLSRSDDSLTFVEAILLGLAQAAALVPGVSRSGAVIVIAIVLGLRRAPAARFAFLLGIPAMVAAGAKGALELGPRGFTSEAQAIFLVGAAVSAIVGYVTIKYFIQYLSRHSLTVFAWYRLALAGIVAGWVAW
ncbi:MAG: undecaprenyl-diphosphate phosphatase [Acidobacteria bacterium]|nr:undecaprenyl-diphosphate phosphatase [Acidobacteriota bacterium]